MFICTLQVSTEQSGSRDYLQNISHVNSTMPGRLSLESLDLMVLLVLLWLYSVDVRVAEDSTRSPLQYDSALYLIANIRLMLKGSGRNIKPNRKGPMSFSQSRGCPTFSRHQGHIHLHPGHLSSVTVEILAPQILLQIEPSLRA